MEKKFRAWDQSRGGRMAYQGTPDLETLQSFIFHFGGCVLMQYIGIKDKNLVEIYEGDYLVDRYPVDEDDENSELAESLLPVIWCNKKLRWCVDVSFKKNGSYLVPIFDYFLYKHIEVKGNIWENKNQ